MPIPPPEQWPRQVRGRSGTVLTLRTDTPVGTGGEGLVLRTTFPDLAVKLCYADQDTPEEIQLRLDRARWLPLEGVPTSQWYELLAPPHTGYVMKLLRDMVPVRRILQAPADVALDHWYGQTGGLRRRLAVLGRCARLLGTLHDRGIVYSDVSPGNLMVSEGADFDEVCLVDLDNLQVESSAASRVVGTRAYTAPEVVTGRTGNTVFSDAYSLAVLAYEALTLNHPMIGDLVADGEFGEEERALRGLVPWIDHSTDGRNRSGVGWQAQHVLTDRLRQLFRRTFEDGLTVPQARPGAGEWAAALFSAADRCVRCGTCPHTFLAPHANCPWCNVPRTAALPVTVGEHWPRPGGTPPARFPLPELSLVLQAGTPLRVTARTAERSAAEPDRALVALEWDGSTAITVHNLGWAGELRLVPKAGGQGRLLRSGSHTTESMLSLHALHFGPDRRPHRVLTMWTDRTDGAR
jgi:hypothetical protein